MHGDPGHPARLAKPREIAITRDTAFGNDSHEFFHFFHPLRRLWNFIRNIFVSSQHRNTVPVKIQCNFYVLSIEISSDFENQCTRR